MNEIRPRPETVYHQRVSGCPRPQIVLKSFLVSETHVWEFWASLTCQRCTVPGSIELGCPSRQVVRWHSDKQSAISRITSKVKKVITMLRKTRTWKKRKTTIKMIKTNHSAKKNIKSDILIFFERQILRRSVRNKMMFDKFWKTLN